MKIFRVILMTMFFVSVGFANQFSTMKNTGFSARLNFETEETDTGFLVGNTFSNSFAGFNIKYMAQNCSAYLGRGYCTDFIAFKTGKRQRGNAGQWSGNIPTNQGRSGDVAIFNSPYPYGHVAYIVRPVYQYNTANLIAYDIEEWNWSNRWVNRACAVTANFGITTSRRVPASSVSCIWRP